MLSESDLHYVLTIEPNDLDFSKVPSCVSIVLNILLYKGINFKAIANETESVMKGILAFLHLIGEQNSSLRTWLQHFLPIQLDIFRHFCATIWLFEENRDWVMCSKLAADPI